ncbi:hypothetical protein K438DRAFT_2031077 [Mycena galopus ATCC 62051]|nr:hypothetical protein K438DRAFT_2031077 [Mycena galopus ATCC 62051]
MSAATTQPVVLRNGRLTIVISPIWDTIASCITAPPHVLAQCKPEEAVDDNDNSTDLDKKSCLSLKSCRSKITLIEHIIEEHCEGELTQDMCTCFKAVHDDHQKQLEARETRANWDEDSVDEQQLDNTENDLQACLECWVDPSLPSDCCIVCMATPSHIKKHLKAGIHHADTHAIHMLIKDSGGQISVQSLTCLFCYHFHRTLYNVCVHIMHIGHALIAHNVLPIYEALVDSFHDSTCDSMMEEQRRAAITNIFTNWNTFPPTLDDLFIPWYDPVAPLVGGDEQECLQKLDRISLDWGPDAMEVGAARWVDEMGWEVTEMKAWSNLDSDPDSMDTR